RHAAKLLACDGPQKLIDVRGATGLEDAFIGYMEDAIAGGAATPGEGKQDAAAPAPAAPTADAVPTGAAAPTQEAQSPMRLRLGRVRVYARNEAMQILRDPV